MPTPAPVALLLAVLAAPLQSVSPGGATSQVVVTTLSLSAPLETRGRLGGLTVAPDGDLFVSNFGTSLWRVSPSGDVQLLSDRFTLASGNAIDAQGRLLQADFAGGSISVVGLDGSVEALVAGGLAGPIGIAAAPTGELYVCCCRSDSIVRVAPDGAPSTFASGPLFDCPNGLVLGADGELYVVNFNDERLVRVEPDGTASAYTRVGVGGRNAHVARIGADLFVTKIETNELFRVRSASDVVRIAGTGERGLADGPGDVATLSRPNGIAAAPGGDALWVNNLDGAWRATTPGRLVLRRIGLRGR